MKTRLSGAAAKRLAEHRERVHGPLATAQKALWEALMRGDITEALRQVDVVKRNVFPPLFRSISPTSQTFGASTSLCAYQALPLLSIDTKLPRTAPAMKPRLLTPPPRSSVSRSSTGEDRTPSWAPSPKPASVSEALRPTSCRTSPALSSPRAAVAASATIKTAVRMERGPSEAAIRSHRLRVAGIARLPAAANAQK